MFLLEQKLVVWWLANMVRKIQPNLSATTGTAACMTNSPVNQDLEDTQVIRQKDVEKSQKYLGKNTKKEKSLEEAQRNKQKRVEQAQIKKEEKIL
jgi:hypothetical protein